MTFDLTSAEPLTMQRWIRIQGARTHNLKNIEVSLPRDHMVVITGVSGSGKSSLAFDTLYAEGQRRYFESLSAYARQFLELMPKPDVDRIEGLSPAISIEQKGVSHNPRSTVGTVTEIYDYLRLLFARLGKPYSPATGEVIEAQTVSQMVDRILRYPDGQQLYVLAPVVRGHKGSHRKLLDDLLQRGFQRVKIDGQLHDLDDIPPIDGKRKHEVAVVVDRLVVSRGLARRLSESLETALGLSEVVYTEDPKGQSRQTFSSRFCCPVSGFTLPEIEPRLFSFNSPVGACPDCGGLGCQLASAPPILEQSNSFWFPRSEPTLTKMSCESCHGRRLRDEALTVKIDGLDIAAVTAMSVRKAGRWIANLNQGFSVREETIANRIIKEIEQRLSFLSEVGLDYLTLERTSATLSGGESQRVRLASQIGSGLTGVMYVLDEPSVGLHQRDHRRLLSTLLRLRDLGNTIVVIEHDRDSMLCADYIVDLGPGAGKHGGSVVAAGTVDEIQHEPNTLTGRYLSGLESMAVPTKRCQPRAGRYLTIEGARTHNLKNLKVSIPLGTFTCVTGVSGSGKSSLIVETFCKAIARSLGGCGAVEGSASSGYDLITGVEMIDKVINIDQSPIGRTPRSNPATYTGVFDSIRSWYAGLPESRARGYAKGRFSFNIKGGRCEACRGDGITRIAMHFLPDVHVECEICRGQRYDRETLEVRFRGRSIADVLAMTVDEGAAFFPAIPAIHDRLKVLQGVGLGYINLGQPATTLSGGEAQRIKLAREMSRKTSGKTLFVLDEPTTGLHFADIKKLLEVLHALVERGNTVVVIEHNLDVIKTADWLIDLGPEGGEQGGELVFQGPPEEIVKFASSHTGVHLATYL